MAKVNFTNVESNSKTRRLGPGIHENATIKTVAFGNSKKKGTPYAEVEFQNTNGTHKEQFYLTEKALSKYKELFMSCGFPEDTLCRETSEDEQRSMLVNKVLRIKAKGEEYLKTDQSGIGIRAVLDFGGFSEPASVAKSESRLTFNADIDIKRLTGDVVTANAADAIDDLDFGG